VIDPALKGFLLGCFCGFLQGFRLGGFDKEDSHVFYLFYFDLIDYIFRFDRHLHQDIRPSMAKVSLTSTED